MNRSEKVALFACRDLTACVLPLLLPNAWRSGRFSGAISELLPGPTEASVIEQAEATLPPYLRQQGTRIGQAAAGHGASPLPLSHDGQEAAEKWLETAPSAAAMGHLQTKELLTAFVQAAAAGDGALGGAATAEAHERDAAAARAIENSRVEPEPGDSSEDPFSHPLLDEMGIQDDDDKDLVVAKLVRHGIKLANRAHDGLRWPMLSLPFSLHPLRKEAPARSSSPYRQPNPRPPPCPARCTCRSRGSVRERRPWTAGGGAHGADGVACAAERARGGGDAAGSACGAAAAARAAAGGDGGG